MTGMEKIERTLRALERIIQSECPQDPLLIDRYDQRLDRATDYREELKDFIRLHPNEFTIVAEGTFKRIIESSEYVEIEEMGYIRIASVKNFPSETYKNYVWIAPITDL